LNQVFIPCAEKFPLFPADGLLLSACVCLFFAPGNEKEASMNYQQFQETLADEVRHRSGGRLSVTLRTVTKNNGVCRRAMEVRSSGTDLHPSIYLDSYFDEYRKGVSVGHLANLVLEQCSEYGRDVRLPENFFRVYGDVSKHLFCKLINGQMNRAELRGVPNRPWMDLTLVCYYRVDETILPDASILIRKEHLNFWGISENRLFEDAWSNTKREQKPVFSTLSSALSEMNIDCAEEESSPLYILTNEQRCFGAVCIGYPDETDRIASEVGGDYYIIPSSIHECLILSADELYRPGTLNRMVREINRSQLEPQEVLSDHVYFYDAKRHAIESLSDDGEDDREEAETV
jgi:hypothetical protein